MGFPVVEILNSATGEGGRTLHRIFRKNAGVFFLCLLILTLPACGDQENETPFEKNPEKSLLIGLIPEQNIFKQLDRYEPLAKYLSEKIGMKIELIVLTRYGNIVDNFVSMSLDGAFFGSFTYAQAHTLLGVEPLVRPLALDGSSTYYGVIITRKDSGIQAVADMRGKRFALVDEETTAGYLFPLIYFSQHGIKNVKKFVQEVYYAGTHESVIEDVLNKKADIGAAKNTVLERLGRSDRRITDELTILAKSPAVPENCLGVSKDIGESIKILMKQALMNMHQNADGLAVLKIFGATQFIETKDSDYSPVYDYAREINLDLGFYDYAREHLKPKQ